MKSSLSDSDFWLAEHRLLESSMFAVSLGDIHPHACVRQVLCFRVWAVGYLSGSVQHDQDRAGAVGRGYSDSLRLMPILFYPLS